MHGTGEAGGHSTISAKTHSLWRQSGGELASGGLDQIRGFSSPSLSYWLARSLKTMIPTNLTEFWQISVDNDRKLTFFPTDLGRSDHPRPLAYNLHAHWTWCVFFLWIVVAKLVAITPTTVVGR